MHDTRKLYTPRRGISYTSVIMKATCFVVLGVVVAVLYFSQRVASQGSYFKRHNEGLSARHFGESMSQFSVHLVLYTCNEILVVCLQ